MYEKHTKTLQAQLTHEEIGMARPDRIEALRAAIELMRAAEPKDEAAEREHCQLAECMWIEPFDARVDRLMLKRAEARADGYQRGHEIARASILECDKLRAQLKALQEAGKPKDPVAEREHCSRISAEIRLAHYDTTAVDIVERDRAAVRAECAVDRQTLTAELERLHAAWEKYTREEREIQAALEAQIAVLQAAGSPSFNDVRETVRDAIAAITVVAHDNAAKLTALREAAKRLVDALDAGEPCEKALEATSAAIEDSK